MGRYALRRLWQMLPVVFIISVAVFSIIHIIPGNPAQLIAGPNATPEQVAFLEKSMGLDQPIWVQYGLWLGNVVRGDLGVSYINKFPVAELIGRRIGATVELAVVSALLGVLIALPLGVAAALRPGSTLDLAVTAFSALSFAIPGFFLAILLVLLFSQELRWLPPSGRPDIWTETGAWLRAILMPSFTLGIAVAAKLVRYLRSALLEVLDQDYVRTARAKGLRDRLVLLRHALPNALIPVVTILALQIGDLLSGAIIIESIFAWPGVGRLTIQAIEWRDYAILQANVLFIVLAVLFVNLIADLTYGWLDPRIHYDES